MMYNNIFLLILVIIQYNSNNTIDGKYCDSKDYSTGTWKIKSNFNSFSLRNFWDFYNNTQGRSMPICASHGDPRRHDMYDWEPENSYCTLIQMDTLNNCFYNKTITFIGDSHYYYAGLAMQYNCKVTNCSYNVEVVRDDHLVYHKNLDVDKSFQTIVKTSQVLIIGTGHHFIPGNDWFPSSNYTLHTVHEIAVKIVDNILLYLYNNFHGEAIVWMSYTPRHFRGGDWNTNGVCTMSNDVPMDSPVIGSFEDDYLTFWNNITNHIENHRYKPKQLFINHITNMSLLRPGAHVGRYNSHKKMDCSHYCMPGVPDEWNRLSATMLCDPHSVYYNLLHS